MKSLDLDETLVRQLMSEEMAATASYLKKAIDAKDEKIAKLFRDIATEELVHFGELREALRKLGIDDKKYLEDGMKEAIDILGK
jgi:rubrerythrin